MLKSILLVTVTLSVFGVQAKNKDVTPDLVSVRCENVINGKSNVFLSGTRSSRSKPLILNVNYKGGLNTSLKGAYKMIRATYVNYPGVDSQVLHIEAQSKDDKAIISVDLSNEPVTTIWIKGKYLNDDSIECSASLAD